MNAIWSKICCSLMISSLLTFIPVNSQSGCTFEADFTNGPNAELITANDGVSLLGIRVLWTIKSEHLNCQFSYLSVTLNSGERRRDITVNDSSADFFNLDCNTEYTPRVRGVSLGIGRSDNGNTLFYGATTNSAPSNILRVCTRTAINNNLNIFWDLLPCHLQNGADITGYIIQYSRTSGGNTSNSLMTIENCVDTDWSDHRHRCLLPGSLFTRQVPYSFQVAAKNMYGVGQFSGLVIGMIESDENCFLSTEPTTEESKIIVTTLLTFTSNKDSEIISHAESNFTDTTTIKTTGQSLNLESTAAAWILVGVLIFIVTILAGLLILSVSFNCILWRQLNSSITKSSSTDEPQSHDCEMDIKKCSAYGHVTSTKTSIEEQHVYESTN